MNWIIIGALIVMAFLFLRIKHMKHKTMLIFAVILLLFIYTTSSQVLSRYEINWKSAGGLEKAVRIYFAWLGGAFSNLRSLTANAIKLDWSAKNQTADAIRIAEKG